MTVFLRILSFLMISVTLVDQVVGYTCYACDEVKKEAGGSVRGHRQSYHSSDCNDGWNTFNCDDDDENNKDACATTHIKACKNGHPYELKTRKCGNLAYMQGQDCKDVKYELESSIEFTELSNIVASTCMCTGDKCNKDDLRSDPGPDREDCPPGPPPSPQGEIECYACFETSGRGSHLRGLRGNLRQCEHEERIWPNHGNCDSKCQTLHVKACVNGDPYEEKIRGCIDPGNQDQFADKYCKDVSEELKKNNPSWGNVAAQLCLCKGGKCNGAELGKDSLNGGGCREEPAKIQCPSSGGEDVAFSGRMRILLGVGTILVISAFF